MESPYLQPRKRPVGKSLRSSDEDEDKEESKENFLVPETPKTPRTVIKRPPVYGRSPPPSSYRKKRPMSATPTPSSPPPLSNLLAGSVEKNRSVDRSESLNKKIHLNLYDSSNIGY